MKEKYFIGTAGWSYKDWVPSFYPKQQSANFDQLSYYSDFFNCVEVNASYYAYLNPGIVNGWLEKTKERENFVFTFKLHQDFTHKRNFTIENINAVIMNLEILRKGERMGGVLIQFPYSFAMNSVNLQYIRKLKEIFQNYNCFVEVRHSSWNHKEVNAAFKEEDITFCTIDQPQIGKSIKFEPIVTNDKAYIRFHGRNVKEWFKSVTNFTKEQSYEQQNERYKYLYSPGELMEIDLKIKDLQESVKELYIIMNNHPTGYAVANAFEMIHLLEERRDIRIPKCTIDNFPRLKQIAKN